MSPDDFNDTAERDPALESLLNFLWKSRGFDFTGYKRSSLSRRIRRRMQMVEVEAFADYQDYLQVHPDEFPQLFNMILINVTSFYRDADAWPVLADHVRSMLNAREPESPIRVWCAGCASGEEAYTLAMVLEDVLGSEQFHRRVKIYATDIDEEALGQARMAAYPAKAVEGLDAAIVERSFSRVGSSYVFNKDLRRAVIFGRHDLVQDAPISRVDILSCRNTLMYFNAEAQARILGRLHFALSPTGLLFLGKAEMLLTHASMFTPLDLKLRLFARVKTRIRANPAPPSVLQPTIQRSVAQHRLQRAALESAPHATIVLDNAGIVVLANLKAATTLGISASELGRPFRDLELSYRPAELRSVIDQVHADNRPTTLSFIERQLANGEKSYLQIDVLPLHGEAGELIGTQLTFADKTQTYNLQIELARVSHELEAAHEELQSTSEELETTNEELQSTVEELETTNEELQSTNEELETMNEELQSTNEELQTMNEELRERSDDLNQTNGLLNTILANLKTGVAVLDAGMLIWIWNHRMEDLWGLRKEEVEGKHFMGLDIGLPIEQLRAGLRSGLTQSSEHTLECTNRRGRAIRCHVRISALATDPASLLVLVEELF